MTWYASQIFAEAALSVRQLLVGSPALADHIYWVNHLEGHQWPQPPQDRNWLKHGLPENGVLVVREVCKPDTAEFAWHGKNAVSWDKLESSASVPILRLSHLPSVSNGNVYFDSDWARSHPPTVFLKYLKVLSSTTKTTVCFYHHASGAERAARQEIAWLFGTEDCVYCGYYPEFDQVSKFTAEGTSQLPGVGHEGRTVLQLVQKHFGLELPSPYFALHTRDFNWPQHRI